MMEEILDCFLEKDYALMPKLFYCISIKIECIFTLIDFILEWSGGEKM